MIPTILSGGSRALRSAEITKDFPAVHFAYIHLTPATASILLSQINDLSRSLMLISPMPRVIWIEEANCMTIPAQNAMLKMLEEPPENTQFILSLDNPTSLLATIRSRCFIKKIENKAQVDSFSSLAFLKTAFSFSAGARITAADSLGRKKEDLKIWLNSALLELNEKLKIERNEQSLAILSRLSSSIHTAYVDLEANVSPLLVMQHLFLSLPHLKR